MNPFKYSKIIEMAKQQSPLLVFDLNIIEQQMKFLESLTRKSKVIFLMAVKSFPEKYVLSLAHKYLSGYDISNNNELNLLPSFLKNHIVWLTDPTGQIISNNSLSNFNKQHTMIYTCDSIIQLNKLINNNSDYVLRLNTDSLLNINPVRSEFGFEGCDLPEVLNIIHKNLNKKPVGFHMHHGWQKNSVNTYLTMAKEAIKLANNLGIKLKFLNLGGGISHISHEDLTKLVHEISLILSKETQLILEPGRFISESAGYAVGKIVSIKRRPGKLFIRLNLSRSCHLKWDNPKIIQVSEFSNNSSTTTDLYGPTCSENDKIGECQIYDNKQYPLKEGDYLLLSHISGYSVAWNHSFNGIEMVKTKYL